VPTTVICKFFKEEFHMMSKIEKMVAEWVDEDLQLMAKAHYCIH